MKRAWKRKSRTEYRKNKTWPHSHKLPVPMHFDNIMYEIEECYYDWLQCVGFKEVDIEDIKVRLDKIVDEIGKLKVHLDIEPYRPIDYTSYGQGTASFDLEKQHG